MKRIAEEKHDVGDQAVITVRLSDRAGNPIDPEGLTVRIKPYGQEAEAYNYGVAAELTRANAGVYVLRWHCAVPGRVQVRAEATGENGTGIGPLAAEGGYFDVRPSNV